MAARHGHGLGGRDLGIALLICVAWALNFLTSAWALHEIPPLLFTAVRLAILALLLGAFLRRPAPGQWPLLFAVAVCNGVLHFGLSFWSLRLAGNLSSRSGYDASGELKRLGIDFVLLAPPATTLNEKQMGTEPDTTAAEATRNTTCPVW